jgi:glycosyltransferase involved in cell wall biosynthesis
VKTDNITPLILTYNEAPNIGRALEKLRWARQIVVIDSFSTDATLDIIAQFPQVKVYQRRFDSFAEQCNFGLSHISTDWVLSMDCDYILEDGLIQEIQSLDHIVDQAAAYEVRFKYAIFGKPTRGTMYPPRKVLYAKATAHYVNDGHGHHVVIDGNVSHLNGYIVHDDHKSLSHWFASQDRYLKKESDKLTNTPLSNLGLKDRLRLLIVVAPFAALFYCLIWKGGILDGWRGWFYAFQRMFAEVMLSLRLIEAKNEKVVERERTNVSDTLKVSDTLHQISA